MHNLFEGGTLEVGIPEVGIQVVEEGIRVAGEHIRVAGEGIPDHNQEVLYMRE